MRQALHMNKAQHQVSHKQTSRWRNGRSESSVGSVPSIQSGRVNATTSSTLNGNGVFESKKLIATSKEKAVSIFRLLFFLFLVKRRCQQNTQQTQHKHNTTQTQHNTNTHNTNTAQANACVVVGCCSNAGRPQPSLPSCHHRHTPDRTRECRRCRCCSQSTHTGRLWRAAWASPARCLGACSCTRDRCSARRCAWRRQLR